MLFQACRYYYRRALSKIQQEFYCIAAFTVPRLVLTVAHKMLRYAPLRAHLIKGIRVLVLKDLRQIKTVFQHNIANILDTLSLVFSANFSLCTTHYSSLAVSRSLGITKQRANGTVPARCKAGLDDSRSTFSIIIDRSLAVDLSAGFGFCSMRCRSISYSYHQISS